MKLLKILGEALKKQKQTYDYGCVMLYFKFPDIKNIHNKLDNNDLYEEENDSSYGIEHEPHTTLLYGLHDNVSLEDVEKVLDIITFSTCLLKNPSLFKNEKYDVFKFDVTGEGLIASNDGLKKYPYTSDFPDYHPHLTIAYLKPGEGEKYEKMFKGLEYELIPEYAVYSKPDGTKEKIKINID